MPVSVQEAWQIPAAAHMQVLSKQRPSWHKPQVVQPAGFGSFRLRVVYALGFRVRVFFFFCVFVACFFFFWGGGGGGRGVGFRVLGLRAKGLRFRVSGLEGQKEPYNGNQNLLRKRVFLELSSRVFRQSVRRNHTLNPEPFLHALPHPNKHFSTTTPCGQFCFLQGKGTPTARGAQNP